MLHKTTVNVHSLPGCLGKCGGGQGGLRKSKPEFEVVRAVIHKVIIYP